MEFISSGLSNFVIPERKSSMRATINTPGMAQVI
jgi:hypothetical protein